MTRPASSYLFALAAGIALLLPAGCKTTDIEGFLAMGEQVARGAGLKENPQQTAGAALREALGIGAERAAATLAKPGGYLRSAVKIGLPEPLQPAARALRAVGLGKYVEALETDMNVSAEIAAAGAAPIFRRAATGMTIEDALSLVNGSDTAATEYFRRQTEGELQTAFKPVIEDGMRRTGYYDSYRALLAKYNALPLGNKPNLDLETWVLDRAIDGLFVRLAEEEQAIRRDPAKQTTALLKKVFGGAK